MIKQIDHFAIVVTDLHGPDGILMELAQYPEKEN